MHGEIQKELVRVVGGPGVSVSEIENQDPASPHVRLETANATYRLPANRLLLLLRELPDQIGVNALRQSIERQHDATDSTP